VKAIVVITIIIIIIVVLFIIMKRFNLENSFSDFSILYFILGKFSSY